MNITPSTEKDVSLEAFFLFEQKSQQKQMKKQKKLSNSSALLINADVYSHDS